MSLCNVPDMSVTGSTYKISIHSSLWERGLIEEAFVYQVYSKYVARREKATVSGWCYDLFSCSLFGHLVLWSGEEADRRFSGH